jgi:flagellar basal-body rod protein FlgC
MTAQRRRLDIIAENITNMNTTRTEDGGAYTRKLTVLESVPSNNFRGLLGDKINAYTGAPGGVRVAEIVEDPTEHPMVYDPTNPDADENGYVEMPNVDLVKEMADAMAASQAYNANITVFNAIKEMALKSLEIGR